MLLARFLFQEASLFLFLSFRKVSWKFKYCFFRFSLFFLCQRGVFCPTCPSPAGGSLIPNQAFPLTIKGKDVTALRCSEPLRSKVGGASKPSPCFAGWDRLGTACFWLHCAWGQLASGFIAPGDSLLLSLAMFCGMGPLGELLKSKKSASSAKSA